MVEEQKGGAGIKNTEKETNNCILLILSIVLKQKPKTEQLVGAVHQHFQ